MSGEDNTGEVDLDFTAAPEPDFYCPPVNKEFMTCYAAIPRSNSDRIVGVLPLTYKSEAVITYDLSTTIAVAECYP
jgi:hypothetical protein